MSVAHLVDEFLSERVGQRGLLLSLLHEVQEAFGCVSPEAERVIAAALNLSRAEVHGVVSFYHDFTQAPDPRPARRWPPVARRCRPASAP